MPKAHARCQAKEKLGASRHASVGEEGQDSIGRRTYLVSMRRT